jgi:hypothetical protein
MWAAKKIPYCPSRAEGMCFAGEGKGEDDNNNLFFELHVNFTF